MGESGPIWLAGALAIAGVAILRISWGQTGRSVGLNAAGWAALLVSSVLAGYAAGAWGIAVAALAATATACTLLLHSGLQKDPQMRVRAARPVRNRELAPERDHQRRIVTFLVAGPLALLVSLLLALTVRGAIMLAGGAEADGNVAVLGTVPLAWPVLAFALLMMAERRHQLAWLLGLAVISAPLALTQGAIA